MEILGRILGKLALLIPLGLPIVAAAQAIENGNVPSFGSVATPRPINAATGTTNPSARATQTLNPYLGSSSDEKVVGGVIKLTLIDAVSRGLRFNLGLIDSQQADARVRAQREHALAALLPQISARAQQLYEQLSFKQLGIRLPPQAGFQLPPTSGAFGYSEVRISAQTPVLNLDLLNRYKQQKALVDASSLDAKDSRDVVVLAVGLAYFQVIATQARLEADDAGLLAAQQLNAQVADQYSSEVSPEIDTLRVKVELHTAEQRVVDATNDLEKDKLTLDRVTGIPLVQKWTPVSEYNYARLPVLRAGRAVVSLPTH
jgi:outer membrane protein TolC